MRVLLAVCGTALFGCTDPMDSASLTFAAEPVEASAAREWGVAHLDGGDHQITIRQAVQTAFACEALDGQLMRSGNGLTLRVRGPADSQLTRDEAPCRYTAILRGVPSGRYTVRIVHTGLVRGKSAEVVFKHPIHIP